MQKTDKQIVAGWVGGAHFNGCSVVFFHSLCLSFSLCPFYRFCAPRWFILVNLPLFCWGSHIELLTIFGVSLFLFLKMTVPTKVVKVWDANPTLQLNNLKEGRLSENTTVKMLSLLKALANIHVLLGIIMIVLSGLADYTSTRINTIRLHGIEEICSLYFVLVGLVGICGSASYRRGLVITYLVMSLHSICIFVPAIVTISSFDIHFYQHECWGECDWHLLATSLPKNSRCQILCGDHVDDTMRRRMSRLGTDYRLDAGLISAAILELLISIVTCVVASRTLFSPLKELQDRPVENTVELQPLNETNEQIEQNQLQNGIPL